jgi:hypothetical protein
VTATEQSVAPPPVRTVVRRYYPVAIGAATLAVVVGLFPTTVPSSSLGLIPKFSAPAVATPVAPSAAAPVAAVPAVGPTAGYVPPVVPSAPLTLPPVVTAPTTTSPPTGAVPTTGSGAVGTGQTSHCSLPIPAEPPPPPAADLIELFTAAGPFGPEATAGAAALAPLVPLVTPVFPLAASIAGGKGGTLISTALVDLADLEDTLFSPFSKEITEITPTFVAESEQFYREIGPILTAASNLPDADCVGDLEIATLSTLVPSAYPGATSLTGLAKSAGTNDAADQRVATVEASWVNGVSTSVAHVITSLLASGVPVEMRLVDDASRAQASDTAGFSAWVTAVMAQFPKVSAWEIDPTQAAASPSGSVAPSDPSGSLVEALTAAAEARVPGQLLGVGYPVLGNAPWWSGFWQQLDPAVRGVVNFVGVDGSVLGGAQGLTPKGLQWIVGLLRRGALSVAGLPATVPLFVTAGTSSMLTPAAQASLAAADAAALSGLGVSLFTWSSPDMVEGQLLTDPAEALSLLSALQRPTTP